ncbi:MAG: hypothetical protein ACQES1_11620 [Bacteroidota bacterium]
MQILKFTLFTFLLCCFTTTNAQTSFRQYKSEDNEKIAFAQGIEINKGYGNTMYEFYPYYRAGEYFMIIDELLTSCYGQCEFYFYFIVDNGQKVFERHFMGTSFKSDPGGSYVQIEIEVDAEFFRSLAQAEKLDFIMSDHKLRKWEEFNNSYNREDLQGFRDFAKGMGLIE